MNISIRASTHCFSDGGDYENVSVRPDGKKIIVTLRDLAVAVPRRELRDVVMSVVFSGEARNAQGRLAICPVGGDHFRLCIQDGAGRFEFAYMDGEDLRTLRDALLDD